MSSTYRLSTLNTVKLSMSKQDGRLNPTLPATTAKLNLEIKDDIKLNGWKKHPLCFPKGTPKAKPSSKSGQVKNSGP